MRRWPVLLSVLLLGACAGTPDSAKPVALPNIERPVALKALWRYEGVSGGEAVFQPAVVGDAVYFADAGGVLRRLRAGAGDRFEEVWRTDRLPQLSGGVAAGGNVVVVGNMRGEVLAFAAEDGRPLWRSVLSAEIISPAALTEGMVVVRSGDNRLHGLDIATGQRKWTYQRPIPALSVRSTAAPVIVDQLAFAGFPGGKVMAVNTTSGAAVWEGTVSLPKGANELERIADVVAPPVLGAREVCAVAHQGRLACFDLTRGNLLWAKDVSSAQGLAIDNRAVYVTDDKGAVHAFDRVTGGSLWKQDKLVNRSPGAPYIRQGHLFVADGLGFVHLLDREDGALRGRLEPQAGAFASPLQAYEAGIIAQTRAGTLLALRAE